MPLIDDVMEFEKTATLEVCHSTVHACIPCMIQIDPEKAPTGTDTVANTKFLLEKIKQLIRRLTKRVILCPLYVSTKTLFSE